MLVSLRRLAALATIGGLLLAPGAPAAFQPQATAASAATLSKALTPEPQLAYYWLNADNDCRPTRQNPCGREQHASVSYDVHYRLQDGTWVGYDSGDWDGPRAEGPSSGTIGASLQTGAQIGGGAVGGLVGKNLADKIRASMAAGSRLAPATNVGLFVAYISPWTGMLIGAMGAAA